MKKITMPIEEIRKLSEQIKEVAQHAELAAESAKASSAIAYQASVESVKSNKDLQASLNAYIKDDTEWKKRAEPAIQLGNSARDASKAVLWIGGAVIIVGGAYKIVAEFLKK